MPPDVLRPEDIAPGAASLGMNLSGVQLRQLADYAQLLMHWNSVHNLTAVRNCRELLTHHLLDSLAIVPHVVRFAAAEPARVLDVGSGGGLPGIVLAIAEPSLRLTLVDAARKKCAFLTQVRLELRLRNVEVVHGRVETLDLPPQDVIVARALAALAQIVAWTGRLLKSGGCWLAMKGKRPDDELSALPQGVHVTVMPLQVPGLDEQRHLIVMRRA